jgi:aryl-alcohol dehydrogenase-like predicted oxidoreductase
MEYVKLGNTNMISSRIGFGTMGQGSPSWRPWVLDVQRSKPVIERAVELGVTFFDTCDFYSKGASERALGETLAANLDREDYILATKVGNQMGTTPTSSGFSKKRILAGVDASLKRLGVDYIDLYQTHVWRKDTDPNEVLDAFHEIVESGKVRYLGATDMPAWQFARLYYEARRQGLHGFRTMQHHYNLAWREHESELIPLCEAEGIGLLPYSPLARGFFSGDPRGHLRPTPRGEDDMHARKWFGRNSDERVRKSLAEVAAARGSSVPATALAWVLHKSPGVPIVGATAVDHLDAIEEALGIELETDEVARLEEHYVARLVFDH